MTQPPQPLDYAHPSTKRPHRTHPLTWAVGGIVGVLLLLALIGNGWSSHAYRPAANRIKCASNLRQIGQATMLYANDHQGRYPDTIGELMEEDITTAVFICPGSNDEPAAAAATTQATAANIHSGGHLSYIYLAKGLTNTGQTNLVLVYEPLSNHQNRGMNVLFGDGHVEWFDLKQATKWLAELNAGHNPPRAEAVK
jgi:prepilin-type processing-associated H-X9-DG protein